MLPRQAILLVLGSAALCAGCNSRRAGDACSDASECGGDSDQLQACVEGYCQDVECLSTSDCPIETVCDVENLDFECEPGCNTDLDCPAGKTCDDGECEAYGCRSSLLDCDRGEFCNEETHECEQAEGAYCVECSPGDNEWDPGEPNTVCDDVLLWHDFCEGYCVAWYYGTPVCMVACEEQEDCPAGYSCQEIIWPLPVGCTQDYAVFGKACVSDCVPG